MSTAPTKGPEIENPSYSDLKPLMCIRYQERRPTKGPEGYEHNWRKWHCGIIDHIGNNIVYININTGGRLEAVVPMFVSQIRVAWEIFGVNPFDLCKALTLEIKHTLATGAYK